MDFTTLETLEFPAVLNELAAFAATPLGRNNILGLKPGSDLSSIKEAFSEFSEVRDFIKVSGRLPVGGVTDLTEVISRAEPEGAYLLPEELILVKNNLSASIQLRALLTPTFSRTYPKLSGKVESISDTLGLHCELERILDDKGEIRDSASPELYRIRKEIRAGKERARTIIESLVADKKIKEILQEDIITIREDRYVLCIKTGFHTGFSGVVHGRSASGGTYFIEPFVLVELNNRVAILKREERSEEIEILKAITRRIVEKKDALLSDQAIAGALDCLQAKALFAVEISAVVPVVKESGEVKLRGARHPLLVLKEKREGARVVPIDVRIPEDCNVLVISGANTGGKTVALKTLGLLTLMALSGTPVPAEEGSEAVVFKEIFSDTGDRQDIIASLSTFSAHVKRLKEFLALAVPGSLVLIDEIGAGTDPSEGGALALAALERLREKGAVSVVTTHLNLLKAHAQVDKSYLNASVEFDESTLKPLYNLMYGLPGPSLGLSIAQSLGIPPELIDRARGNIKEKEGAFIESVRILEGEKEEVRKLKESLRILEEKRHSAVERLKNDRAAILEKMKGKIDALVDGARKEMKEAVERLKEEGKTAGAAKASAAIEEAASKVVSYISPVTEKYAPEPGDRVGIKGSITKGVVVNVDRQAKKAELKVGALKVWVNWNKLTKRSGNDKIRVSKEPGINADILVASSVNIIGMRVEEALPVVTRFLDNSHAEGMARVEIIHGVGTGRLAKWVEEYLKDSPLVKSFSPGDPVRGGGGVTVVELK